MTYLPHIRTRIVIEIFYLILNFMTNILCHNIEYFLKHDKPNMLLYKTWSTKYKPSRKPKTLDKKVRFLKALKPIFKFKNF